MSRAARSGVDVQIRTSRNARHADVVALGVPALAVADEDRGLLEDLVAELLVAAIERDEEPSR